MNAAKRYQIFERLRDATPLPETELSYDSPFELLIAVILSAQATDVSVNLATRKLYPVANTPAKVLALGVEGLTPYIRNIGLAVAFSLTLVAGESASVICLSSSPDCRLATSLAIAIKDRFAPMSSCRSRAIRVRIRSSSSRRATR